MERRPPGACLSPLRHERNVRRAPCQPWTVTNDSGRPNRAAIEAYLGRVNAVLIDLTGVVPAGTLNQAQHLIDSGEPAEGLLGLAWAIADGGYRVPRSAVEDIRALTVDLVPEDSLPPDLDELID